VSWILPHAVSNAILDVAFAEVEPPIAVNLVHPKPIAWKTLMQPVADAIFELNITSNPIPLAPFSEWLEKLESSAKDSSEETIKRIVSVSFRLDGTFSHLVWYYSLLSSFSTSCVS
jgi:hypothetical protein